MIIILLAEGLREFGKYMDAANQKGAIQLGIEMFLKKLTTQKDYEILSGLVKKLANNANLDYAREYLFDFVTKMSATIGPSETVEMFQDYIEQMRALGVPMEIYIDNLEMQKNFAVKFWNYLLDNNRIGDFSILFNFAFLMEIQRLENALRAEDKTPYIRELHQNMMRLIDADKTKAEEIYKNMWNYIVKYPPPDTDQTNLFIKMISSVNEEIVGLLIKFPYLELTRGKGNLFPFLN